MFTFEQFNGELIKDNHSRNHVLHEIAERYVCRKTLDVRTIPESKVEPKGFRSDIEVDLTLFNATSIDETKCFECVNINGEKFTSLIYKQTKSIDFFLAFN